MRSILHEMPFAALNDGCFVNGEGCHLNDQHDGLDAEMLAELAKSGSVIAANQITAVEQALKIAIPQRLQEGQTNEQGGEWNEVCETPAPFYRECAAMLVWAHNGLGERIGEVLQTIRNECPSDFQPLMICVSNLNGGTRNDAISTASARRPK